MAIYKISDLLLSLGQAAGEGFEYVDLSEVTPDDGEPACLYASYIIETHETEDDFIDSSVLPENYHCHVRGL